MINQEIFDQSVSHLRAQNNKAVRSVSHFKRDEMEPAYKGDDGKLCPTAAIIGEDYDKEMEGCCFSSYLNLAKTAPALKEKWGEHAELLDALDYLHDHYLIDQWEDGFINIASSFKLTLAKKKEEKNSD